MSAIIQTMTFKVTGNHEEALAATKKTKDYLEGKGASVRCFWAIEAGAASGTATLSIEFPSASAWAELVDSDDSGLKAFRQHAVQGTDILATSLLQEVDL